MKKFFTNGAIIPVIFIVFGICGTLFSIWGTFESYLWKETLGSLGKTILASGFFAGMLKLMQFNGVFKEEITRVIFEPKFLGNRKDLPDYWIKVSSELFKNKFPDINRKLLKDIQDRYMPTNETLYYDDTEHIIEITFIDKGIGLVELIHTVTTNAVSVDKKDCHEYSFKKHLPVNDFSEKQEFAADVTINGVKHTFSDLIPKHISNGSEKILEFECNVELKGCEKYQIKRVDRLKYNIYDDNVFYYKAAKMHHKLKVEVHYPKQDLTMQLKKCGILENFLEKNKTINSVSYICTGVLYAEQGYYLNFQQTKQQTK